MFVETKAFDDNKHSGMREGDWKIDFDKHLVTPLPKVASSATLPDIVAYYVIISQ